MKKLLVILCLLPSMFINAQVVDWNTFNEKSVSTDMFTRLNRYTMTECGYSLTLYSDNDSTIYNCIQKNSRKMSTDDLSGTINSIVPENFTGILGKISCKDSHNNYLTYQDIVRKCLQNWIADPSDRFFMKGCGTQVIITTFYNKKTETVYISVIYIATKSDPLPIPIKG
jgi:hypothetical protein